MQAEMLGLKKIMVNLVGEPSFKADVSPNSAVLHLCLAWVTGKRKEGEEKGSEQKHCIVPWDSVATWRTSGSLKVLEKGR